LEAFERFVQAYPARSAPPFKPRDKALACFQARLTEGISAEDLILAAERYAKSNQGMDFVKLMATFLGGAIKPNGRPYLDYLGEEWEGDRATPAADEAKPYRVAEADPELGAAMMAEQKKRDAAREKFWGDLK